jgi:hypothetical protein
MGGEVVLAEAQLVKISASTKVVTTFASVRMTVLFPHPPITDVQSGLAEWSRTRVGTLLDNASSY